MDKGGTMRRFVVIFALSSLSLFASGIENLSLDRAMEILHTKNPQLIISKLEIESRQKDIAMAESSRWGELDLVQSAARSNDPLNVLDSNSKAVMRVSAILDLMSSILLIQIFYM